MLSHTDFVFNLHALPPLLTAFGILLLGIIVIIREKASRESLLYLSYTLAASAWMFCVSVALFTPSEERAYRWMTFGNASVTVIPAALYHFTVVVMQRDNRHRLLVRIAWAISAFFFAMTLLTDVLFDGLYHYSWGIFLKYRWPSFFFMAYFLAMTVMTLSLYSREYRRTDRQSTRHRRAKAFLVAFSIGYLGALDFLPALGVPYYPLSFIPMICMLILVSQAIWRYRFVDITPAFAAQEIIDTMGDSLIVLDRDGIIRLVNRATCSLLCCGEQDLIGKRPADCMAGFRQLAGALQALSGNETIRSREVHERSDDGRERILSVSASMMRSISGEQVATVWLVNEITDRKRSETSLLLFRNLLDQSHDAIFVNDPETGRFLMVNDKACSNLGYSREQLLSLTTLDVETIFAEKQVWDAHVRAVRDRGHLILEGIHKRRDGSPLPVEVSVSYMTWGGRNYMVALARDISDRRAAEAALRQSEVRLSKAQRMAQVGNWEWDLVTNELWWSEEVYRIYGVDPAHFTPTFDAVGKAMHPGDLAPFMQAVKAAIDEQKPFSMDYRLVRPDGSIRTVHTIGEVTRDPLGNPLIKSGTVQDVSDSRRVETEREQLIEELQQANEKLQSIDKMKTNFISTVSHELRTPLTTIKAFVELLLLKPGMPDDQKMKLMRTVSVETDRLARLITDLLDLSRIETGAMKLQFDDLAMGDLVQSVIAGMGLLFENKGLRVTTQYASPLSRVSGDRDRLVQVVTNILSNAVKFTPRGGQIHVAVREEKPEAEVAVEISDSGIGIPPAHLGLVFEKFHRADDNLTAAIEGTGLGLAISRQIVEHHGGRIWAASTQGKGSTFTFTLPMTENGRGAVS